MKMTDAAYVPFSARSEVTQHPPVSVEASRHINRATRISLKQWRMFHAVIEFNGFVEAAEKLHVSQSSISHALSKLQEQLGLSLLTLRGRKSQLTDEGIILLERSRDLVKSAVEIEEMAENLRQGWAPELRLAVDFSFPAHLLTQALQKLSPSLRKMQLRVQEANAEQASQALHDNATDFAISTKIAMGFVSRELIGIEYVPVAEPGNVLFSLKRELTLDDLRGQCQVVVSDCNDYAATEADRGLTQLPRARKVSSLDLAVAALGEGQGYAWLPKTRLRQWLDMDLLRILPLNSGSSRTIPLYLIFGRSVTASPCATRFAEALRSCGGSVI